MFWSVSFLVKCNLRKRGVEPKPSGPLWSRVVPFHRITPASVHRGDLHRLKVGWFTRVAKKTEILPTWLWPRPEYCSRDLKRACRSRWAGRESLVFRPWKRGFWRRSNIRRVGDRRFRHRIRIEFYYLIILLIVSDDQWPMKRPIH